MTERGGGNTFLNPLPGVPDVESPFFERLFSQKEPPAEIMRIANDLRERGFAVFDFPDPDFDTRSGRVIGALEPSFDLAAWRGKDWQAGLGLRIQDAWLTNEDVKAIAVNKRVLEILGTLFGRRAIPFQTLNFPVGTQQPIHSDSLHFSSIPERFMCGVWVAFEDTDASNGSLEYYPGSHRLPVYVNEHLNACAEDQSAPDEHYPSFVRLWRELVEAHGFPRESFHARKGQGLIWLANLLHGGSRQVDPMRTRWSQVTHYYFEGCTYYTPLMSDPGYGTLFYRDILDISTGNHVPNLYSGRPVSVDVMRRSAPHFQIPPPAADNSVPPDFDPAAYLAANADVAAAGHDPVSHWQTHGWKEGRRLR